MTYTQAYNKIIDAYFRDEIRPMDSQFCFCGTLEKNWNNGSNSLYSLSDLKEMEFELLLPLRGIYTRFVYVNAIDGWAWTWADSRWMAEEPKTLEYEDALFAGMSAALDVLKQIHESRGEVIDQPQTFTKRILTL